MSQREVSEVEEFDGCEGEGEEDTLALLQEVLLEAVSLEEHAVSLEEDLKQVKSSLRAMKEQRIPELMASLRMEQMTWNGWSITIKDFVSGVSNKSSCSNQRAMAFQFIPNFIAINFVFGFNLADYLLRYCSVTGNIHRRSGLDYFNVKWLHHSIISTPLN
jgi:hypothetical protein